jgi:P-loop containing dynein motor region D4
MLIGVGGCGKSSIARLAAFAAGCDVFEITLSRGYNESSFKDDLKALFSNLTRKPTIFLFSSAQVSVKSRKLLGCAKRTRQALLKFSHSLLNVKQN